MILALETGWTPDTLAELPERFRRACHWLLYARVLSGPNGLAVPKAPPGASPAERAEYARAAVNAAELRTALYPEGDE